MNNSDLDNDSLLNNDVEGSKEIGTEKNFKTDMKEILLLPNKPEVPLKYKIILITFILSFILFLLFMLFK